MSSPTNITARNWALTTVPSNEQEQQAVEAAMQEAGGDWSQARQSLSGSPPDGSVAKLTVVHGLANWSNGHVPLVLVLTDDPEVTSPRDMALDSDAPRLAALIDPNDLPADAPGASVPDKQQRSATELGHHLFDADPTDALDPMVVAFEIPITKAALRVGVMTFPGNRPEFNVRTTSVYTAFSQPGASTGITPDGHAAVADGERKTLRGFVHVRRTRR